MIKMTGSITMWGKVNHDSFHPVRTKKFWETKMTGEKYFREKLWEICLTLSINGTSPVQGFRVGVKYLLWPETCH